MDNCVFCMIAEGKIGCKKVYEDDTVIAFHDIEPQAPVHVLVIPKRHTQSILTADKELMGHMLDVCAKLSKESEINPYRTCICIYLAAGRCSGLRANIFWVSRKLGVLSYFVY